MVGSTQAQPRVTADVVLPVAAPLAAERLARAFQAAGHGGQVLMVVGPGRRSRLVGKHVRATLTPRGRRGSTEVFDLHWEPVGPAASAYPSLDARLGITAVEVRGSLLSIVASYRPPLGPLGATLDRAAMSRVAAATITSILHRLAGAITNPSRPIAAGPSGSLPADSHRSVRSVTP